MKTRTIIVSLILTVLSSVVQFVGQERYFHPEFASDISSSGDAYAYPPGVGILTKSKNCMACHINNGVWSDEDKTIIDVLDAETKKSLKRSDGSFLIEVKRNQARTVLTVIGRSKDDEVEKPYRNAWTYIDPKTIGSSSLSKFAPGWECNLQLACRVVGDNVNGYEGATITALPMTVRPTDAARNSELQLQVMLTKGESVKGNSQQGMKGNYFEKVVHLEVLE